MVDSGALYEGDTLGDVLVEVFVECLYVALRGLMTNVSSAYVCTSPIVRS